MTLTTRLLLDAAETSGLNEQRVDSREVVRVKRLIVIIGQRRSTNLIMTA